MKAHDMIDIVERLKEHSKKPYHPDEDGILVIDAADEIERLRAYAQHERDLGAEEVAKKDAVVIQSLQNEIERLRAEVASLRLTLGGKTFSADIPEPVGCPMPGACAQVEEIKRLREALRMIAWDIEGNEPDLGECMAIAAKALTGTAKMTEWQPIEACPENTWVLLAEPWSDNPRVTISKFTWKTFTEWETVSESSGASGLRRKIEQEKQERRRVWANGIGELSGDYEHWMPLPEPTNDQH